MAKKVEKKLCIKCREVKLVSDFYEGKNSCKECCAIARKACNAKKSEPAQFKVGDVVKFKKWLNACSYYGGIYMATLMAQYKKTFVLKKKTGSGFLINLWSKFGGEWNVAPEMLVLVEKKSKTEDIKITENKVSKIVFKEGDWVRFKKGLVVGNQYKNIAFNIWMLKKKGAFVLWEKSDDDFYTDLGSKCMWKWFISPEMLEHATVENPKVDYKPTKKAEKKVSNVEFREGDLVGFKKWLKVNGI